MSIMGPRIRLWCSHILSTGDSGTVHLSPLVSWRSTRPICLWAFPIASRRREIMRAVDEKLARESAQMCLDKTHLPAQIRRKYSSGKDSQAGGGQCSSSRNPARQPPTKDFFCREDYKTSIALVFEAKREAGAEIWAYCLMPQHVHLIVLPEHPSDAREWPWSGDQNQAGPWAAISSSRICSG